MERILLKKVVYFVGIPIMLLFLAGSSCLNSYIKSSIYAQISTLELDLKILKTDREEAVNQSEIDRIDREIANKEAELLKLNKKLAALPQEKEFIPHRDADEEKMRLKRDIDFSRNYRPEGELLLRGEGCFTGDTLVLGSDGSRIRIDRLKTGDPVATWDQVSGLPAEGIVEKFLKTDSDHYYLINSEIKVTQLHRVLTVRGEWIRVKDLREGMILQSQNGPLAVQSIVVIKSHLPVYNLDVAHGESYLVAAGQDNWLVVHNGGGGGGK